ncbi:hypothetical protein QFC24_001182 [Naganishia onofrii]|uniref:Uncharacterized protein n=1 Tax=Naganishia onofrii TaxID=1851511 RepID=A0ACC2XTJ6_9TREE|nr:hypothetical protein QFC24_001182 [Naganishia onofrii]
MAPRAVGRKSTTSTTTSQNTYTDYTATSQSMPEVYGNPSNIGTTSAAVLYNDAPVTATATTPTATPTPAVPNNNGNSNNPGVLRPDLIATTTTPTTPSPFSSSFSPTTTTTTTSLSSAITTPHLPFPIDYFEVVVTLCEIIRLVYTRIGELVLGLGPAATTGGGRSGVGSGGGGSASAAGGTDPGSPISSQPAAVAAGSLSEFSPLPTNGFGLGRGTATTPATGTTTTTTTVVVAAAVPGVWTPLLLDLIGKLDAKLKVCPPFHDLNHGAPILHVFPYLPLPLLLPLLFLQCHSCIPIIILNEPENKN